MKSSRSIRAVALAGATIGALALAACSGDGGAGSDEEVVLELVQSGDVNQGNGYAQLAEKYYDESGVRVEVVEVPNDDLMTRLRTASQADDLPALAAAPSVDPAWTDRMLDLTDIFDEVGVIDTLSVTDPADDKVKALPTTLTSVGMFLNTSLWDQAGVSYPTSIDDAWTWDEFVEKATQVVDVG